MLAGYFLLFLIHSVLISNKSSLSCHFSPLSRKLISRSMKQAPVAFRRQAKHYISLQTVHFMHIHLFLDGALLVVMVSGWQKG